MKKTLTAALLTGITLACSQTVAPAREIHPKKMIFQDVESWPATAPGDVELKNFAPFRAVYDRTYKQGSGPNAGDPRLDHVIITAEDVGWDGRRAAAITIIDSGIVEHDDTNARALTMFVGLDDLRILFEIGPIPGKAKDYYIGRVTPDTIFMNEITTDTQKLKTERMKTGEPGFGPGAWVMASMNLSEGLKINLSPYYTLLQRQGELAHVGELWAHRRTASVHRRVRQRTSSLGAGNESQLFEFAGPSCSSDRTATVLSGDRNR